MKLTSVIQIISTYQTAQDAWRCVDRVVVIYEGRQIFSVGKISLPKKCQANRWVYRVEPAELKPTLRTWAGTKNPVRREFK